MCKIQDETGEFLFKHPTLNLMVISSSSKGRNQHSNPPHREGKKLDSFGRHFYSSGALGIKAYNYLSCMDRYIHAIFKDLTEYLPLIPKDKRAKALQLHSEGLAAAKQEIISSKHPLEVVAKPLKTAVAFPLRSWLRATHLPFDTRALWKACPSMV